MCIHNCEVCREEAANAKLRRDKRESERLEKMKQEGRHELMLYFMMGTVIYYGSYVFDYMWNHSTLTT